MRRPLPGPARNRTGIATALGDAEKTIEGARAGVAAPHLEGQALAATRFAYGRSAGSVGTVAPASAARGAPRSVLDALPAQHPLVFLDLLGERLAFERVGTRLYEAFLVKVEAAPSSGAPPHEHLERMRDEELRHVGLLKRAVESLGSDPTVLTPSADIACVAVRGLIDAVTDPRSTAVAAMEALLMAELVDNDGWLVLADLGARLGHDDLAAEFRHAMAEEEEHLARVRAWLTAAFDAEAGLSPEAPYALEHHTHH